MSSKKFGLGALLLLVVVLAVARGYWQSLKTTKVTLVDGELHSGDFSEILKKKKLALDLIFLAKSSGFIFSTH